MTILTTKEDLLRENEALRRRLEEADETLRAIQAGEVDAFVIAAGREQVFTLETFDQPYRLLVAQVPSAAATLTADGSVISCNYRFADLLQRPPSSFCSRPICDFVAAESRATLKALLRDGMTAEVQDYVTLLRADGTPISAYLDVRMVSEGAFGLCLMITDLTEQRRFEELQRTQQALRESEDRLARDLAAAQRLQEISIRLIQEGDVDQLYDQILDAAIAMMRSEFATLQMFDSASGSLRLLANRGFSESFSEAFRAVETGASTTCGLAWRSGRRIVASDLETFDGIAGTEACQAHLEAGVRAAQSTPLLSRSGELLGMISTHWSVPHEPTERDLQLFDVLARQAADLIERTHAERALRDADRKKDEFLAMLAHELRNPLAPIRHAVHILQAKGPDDPELQWASGVIDRQVQLMARLLEDLLDVSRISRNTLKLRKERVELAAIVETAVETSRPVIDAGRHELVVELPHEPIRLEADPVRLAQVFVNLLNNAAKYSDDNCQIRLSALLQGNEVVVSVKDHGIGIGAEMLPRIFEIFSQEQPSLKRSQTGLGIGLSLVKGMIELHGGSVKAKSDGPGRGSEFTIRLPVVAESSSQELDQPAEGDAQRRLAKRRILVVDDNRDSADCLSMLLKVMGHEVSTAYNGEQAVEAAGALRPDVVLLDLGMPKLDGYDVCGLIRKRPWGRKMFLVALTGWGQEDDRRRTEAAGFDHHLVKPVAPAELSKLLEFLPSEGDR